MTIRDLTNALGRDHYLARELVYALARDRGPHLSRARARAHELVHDLSFNRKEVRTSCWDIKLERAYDIARYLERDLTSALNRDLSASFDRFNELACELERELARAHDRALKFIPRPDSIPMSGHTAAHPSRAQMRDKRNHMWPARSASHLTNVAAGLLPRHDRLRYSEEYQGELAVLADAGTGRWHQFCFAARLLVRAPMLRATLVLSARRQAAR
jgi:hypothetical protein